MKLFIDSTKVGTAGESLASPSRRRKSSDRQSTTSSSTPQSLSPSRTTPLGTGTLNKSRTAVSEFVPSPESTSARNSFEGTEQNESSEGKERMGKSSQKKTSPKAAAATTLVRSKSDIVDDGNHREVVFKRAYSSFLRVADLDMDDTSTLRSQSEDSEESHPNFHHMAVDPPPGVEMDPKERWVVLDDGDGKHAPIAPLAVNALARSGLSHAFNVDMWAPDGKTGKILKQTAAWNSVVWQKEGAVVLPSKGTLDERDILVWSGTFKHGHYGSELPAVRSCGIIDSTPQSLMELLVDSSRVKEYNKLCLGRSDALVLQGDMAKSGTFGGVTKVMKTETKPPMVRKTLRFTSLLHARELEDGSGYKLVTRAVHLPEEKEDLANALKSEILLGATVIKRVDGDDNRCFFVSVNHIRSPMVPMMIAKRIGLQAAVGFIQDLRGCKK